MTSDPTTMQGPCGAGILPAQATANQLLFVFAALVARHTVFAEEAFHTTLGVNNLLSAGVKGVVTRPYVYV